MGKIFNRQIIYTFIVGASVGIAALSVLLLIMFLRGDLQKLLAAGVGTGAPDVNARYLDGYGTAQTVTPEKIYISEPTTGYLPDNTVDAGAIVNGAVGSADIADGAVASVDIANGTIVDADISGTAAIAKSKISSASNWTIEVTQVSASCSGGGQSCTSSADCTCSATASCPAGLIIYDGPSLGGTSATINPSATCDPIDKKCDSYSGTVTIKCIRVY